MEYLEFRYIRLNFYFQLGVKIIIIKKCLIKRVEKINKDKICPICKDTIWKNISSCFYIFNISNK